MGNGNLNGSYQSRLAVLRNVLIATLLATLISGCLRTYRMERASYSDSRLHLDGSASTTNHEEGAAREWRGFWPLPPSRVQR